VRRFLLPWIADVGVKGMIEGFAEDVVHAAQDSCEPMWAALNCRHMALPRLSSRVSVRLARNLAVGASRNGGASQVGIRIRDTADRPSNPVFSKAD
jgi:hypothetical protein